MQSTEHATDMRKDAVHLHKIHAALQKGLRDSISLKMYNTAERLPRVVSYLSITGMFDRHFFPYNVLGSVTTLVILAAHNGKCSDFDNGSNEKGHQPPNPLSSRLPPKADPKMQLRLVIWSQLYICIATGLSYSKFIWWYICEDT